MKAIKTMQQIGDCTLYLGDAQKILPGLIDDGLQADCTCMDPPYLLTSGGNGPPSNAAHIRMSGIFRADKYDNGGHLVACDLDWGDFMPLVFAAMGRGHAYVMANNRNVQPMLNAAAAAGFGFHNLLTWDKGTATPNRWYMKNIEFTGMFYKGKARMINDCGSMSGIRMTHTDESNHPTEKPVELMKYYILNSTQPGDTVLDMFMGSGTTGVAAARTGRRFIGIEMDEAHFKTSLARIEKAYEYRQETLL